jgi:enediyne polyketide synthase
VRELTEGGRVLVALERDGAPALGLRGDVAIRRALGQPLAVRRDGFGRPGVDADLDVSAAHAGPFTLAVAGPSPVACDLEAVNGRDDESWRALLGAERWRLAETLAQRAGEERRVAATRVWTAIECLKKAGAAWSAPLLLGSSGPDGWACLQSPEAVVATCATRLRGSPEVVVLAVLMGKDSCAATSTVTASPSKTRTS